jgi:hypothetical protein
MDTDRFEALLRSVAALPSRRRALRLLIGSAVGGLLTLGTLPMDAKKKHCPKAKPKRCGDKCCKPSDRCKKGKCVDHCRDGVKNFGETDIDCGGTCVDPRGSSFGTCVVGKGCKVDSDCFTGRCLNQTCVLCRIDSDCVLFGSAGLIRCVGNDCVECAADFDCPRPGQAPTQTACTSNRCTDPGCRPQGASCTNFQDGSDNCCDVPVELSCEPEGTNLAFICVD